MFTEHNRSQADTQHADASRRGPHGVRIALLALIALALIGCSSRATPTSTPSPKINLASLADDYLDWWSEYLDETTANAAEFSKTKNVNAMLRANEELYIRLHDRFMRLRFPASMADDAARFASSLEAQAAAFRLFAEQPDASRDDYRAAVNEFWEADQNLRWWLGIEVASASPSPAPSSTPRSTPTATPKPTPRPTLKPTPKPTPKPTQAPAVLTGNWAGFRMVGGGMSIECYTFFRSGRVEIRHSGVHSDTGRYYGDRSSGEIRWNSGRRSTVVAVGRLLRIDAARMDPIQTCIT